MSNSKLKIISVFCVGVLASCSSAHHVQDSACTAPQQSAACASQCSGFDGSSRPLWCDRLFCVHGAPIYGEWCSAENANMVPSEAEINAITSSANYLRATGVNSTTGKNVDDNNLAFLQAAVTKYSASGHSIPSVSVFMIGNSVGQPSNVITGDDGSRLHRQHLVVNSGIDYTYTADTVASDAALPAGQIHGTGGLNNWYATDAGNNYYNRSSTTYAAAILGHKKGGDTMGFGGTSANLYVYNALDNLMLTSHYTDAVGGGANYGALQTRISKAIEQAGLVDRIPNPVPQQMVPDPSNPGSFIPDPNYSSTIPDPNARSVVSLNFEGFRDGSQLANGYSILRKDSGTGNGLDGEYGEGNVSYMLTNICPPGEDCSDPQSYSGRYLNATFAPGLQLKDLSSTSSLYKPKYTGVSTGMIGTNYAAADNAMLPWAAAEIAEQIGQTLAQKQNFIFVVGSGVSSVNNTGGAYKLFYSDYAAEKAGASAGEADWYNEEAWYKSQNIFQTNGATASTWTAARQCSGADCNYVPTYLAGNSESQTSQIQMNIGSTVTNQYMYTHFRQQDGSLLQNDMSYTSSYPTAFLSHLLANNYDSNGGTGSTNGVFNMSRYAVWDETSANDRAYSITRFRYTGAAGTGQSDIVQTQFMLGVGRDGMQSYASSNAYRFLVAGALDTSGQDTSDGLESLVAYTNAAGTAKYNYLTVNVNKFQNALYQNDGGHLSRTNGTASDDTSADYGSGGNFYTRKANGYAKYNYSPSLMANSVLTGYVERLYELFNNASGNDIAFALRQTANPLYGRNYELSLDGQDREINQLSYYFTNNINSGYKTAADDEQNSLNTLNAQAGRDVMVFTGVSTDQEYDSMYNQMFSSSKTGTASLLGDMIRPNLFASGNSVTSNTNFFTGPGVWNYDSTNKEVTVSVGGHVYKRYKAEYENPDGSSRTPALPDVNKQILDPNTRIGGTGTGTEGQANSFLTLDVGSQYDVKFNWQYSPKTYYNMRFLGCSADVVAAGGCSQSTYQARLKEYYDAAGTPDADRDLIDLNVDANGVVTACNGTDCNYKYTDSGYDDIHLKYFNEHKNVLLMAVEDTDGKYSFGDKKVDMVVMVLDPAIRKDGGGISPEATRAMDFFVKLNTAIDDADTAKLDALGIKDIKLARVSDDCVTSLQCTYDDLSIMFRLQPNLFSKAPSNVYGYGNVDLEESARNLMYQQEYFYSSVTGSLSRQLQQFFYNKGCRGENCGVKLSDEFGFDYKPNAYHDTVDDADGNNKVVGHVKNPYGDTDLTADDINNAIGYVNGYPGMMIGYLMGAFGPSMQTGFNNFTSKKSAAGSQLSFYSQAFGGSMMVGGQVVSTLGFSKYSITNADRNSDQFGYALMPGMTTFAFGMLGGLRYNQKIGDTGEMKVMMFGNKNEHDLINSNYIGRKLQITSMYMLTGNQQGMFGNPYFRYAGSYMGSIYSYQGSMLEGALQYRMSAVQAFNPLSDLFSFNSNIGGFGAVVTGGGLGIGSNPSNSLQEFQLMYNKKNSSYSFSYGFLNEADTVMGARINPGGQSSTYYMDAKIIQHLGKGFYAMGHYNVGFTNVTAGASNVFTGFENFVAHKFSVGLVKDNVFGGSLFITYTEPNRLMSGLFQLNAFNASGDVTNIGSANLARLEVERNYEAGYAFKFKGYDCVFSAMLRTNPYALADVDSDGLFMLRMNGHI